MSSRFGTSLGALLAATALASCTGGDGGGDAHPGSTVVRAASGASFDLAGTTWATCYANDPAPGESYLHVWSFATGTATIRHDVFTASTDCTGTTNASEHFEVTLAFDADGGSRVVGWDGSAPAGYPATVTATGVTFSGVSFPGGGATRKGVAYVDDQRTPAWLFLTNPGDSLPPVDSAGYPTVLSTLEHERQ